MTLMELQMDLTSLGIMETHVSFRPSKPLATEDGAYGQAWHITAECYDAQVLTVDAYTLHEAFKQLLAARRGRLEDKKVSWSKLRTRRSDKDGAA